MPGNVVVYVREGRTRVAAVEPATMLYVVETMSLRRSPSRSARICSAWSMSSPKTDIVI